MAMCVSLPVMMERGGCWAGGETLEQHLIVVLRTSVLPWSDTYGCLLC